MKLSLKKTATTALTLCFFSSLFIFPASSADGLVTEIAQQNGKLSVDFKDADLKDVLKVFSQQSGYNFIASQAVQDTKITLYLNDVSVDDAMEKVVLANNLRFEKDVASNIIVVYPMAMQSGTGVKTRVFTIKHTRLSGSALGVGGDGVINELSSAVGVTSGTSGAGTAPTGTSNRRGIDEIVTQFLSSQGRLTVDLRTNSLVVADLPDNLAIIEEILKSIDVPAKQVMIDVHVLEIKASLNKDIGVDYGGTDGALLSVAGGQRSTAFPFNDNIFRGVDNNPRTRTLSPTLTSIQDLSGQTVPSITLGTISASNLAATLRFLTQQTDTKILARPRVLALNNEAAVIRLVTNTSIANTSTSSSSGGALGATTTDVAERVETGIVLRMTPQINNDGSVELFIEPAVTTAAVSTFFPNNFLDPTTRSIRTTVRVHDNETLVIGGLIDKDSTKTAKKLPILGDLPLVGKAFRYDEEDIADRELMIFLTPRIIPDTPQVVQPLSSSNHVQHQMKELLNESAQQKSLFHERDVTAAFKEAEMRRTLASLKKK